MKKLKFKLNILQKVLPLFLIIFLFLFNFNRAWAVETRQDKTSTIQFEPENALLATNIQSMVIPAKEHIKKTTGLSLDKPVLIKLCSSTASFSNITGITNVSVQGIAISEYNMIIINAENIFSKSTSDIEHLIEHEITHLVLGNNIISGSGKHLPRWFNEGVAQWVSEGASELFSSSYQGSLQSAFLTERLLPFSTLSESFPPEQSGFILAYAQSLSFIEFLVEENGEDKLNSLMQLLKSEKDFYRAFQQVYFFPLEQAEQEWVKTKKKSTYTYDYFLATNINTIIDSFVGFTAFCVFIIFYFRNKARKKKMAESELENEPEIS